MAFPLTAVGSLNSMFFGIYGNTIKRLGEIRGEEAGPSYSSVILAGGLAAGLQAIPATPIELVKVKLQCQTGRFHIHNASCTCICFSALL